MIVFRSLVSDFSNILKMILSYISMLALIYLMGLSLLDAADVAVLTTETYFGQNHEDKTLVERLVEIARHPCEHTVQEVYFSRMLAEKSQMRIPCNCECLKRSQNDNFNALDEFYHKSMVVNCDCIEDVMLNKIRMSFSSSPDDGEARQACESSPTDLNPSDSDFLSRQLVWMLNDDTRTDYKQLNTLMNNLHSCMQPDGSFRSALHVANSSFENTRDVLFAISTLRLRDLPSESSIAMELLLDTLLSRLFPFKSPKIVKMNSYLFYLVSRAHHPFIAKLQEIAGEIAEGVVHSLRTSVDPRVLIESYLSLKEIESVFPSYLWPWHVSLRQSEFESSVDSVVRLALQVFSFNGNRLKAFDNVTILSISQKGDDISLMAKDPQPIQVFPSENGDVILDMGSDYSMGGQYYLTILLSSITIVDNGTEIRSIVSAPLEYAVYNQYFLGTVRVGRSKKGKEPKDDDLTLLDGERPTEHFRFDVIEPVTSNGSHAASNIFNLRFLLSRVSTETPRFVYLSLTSRVSGSSELRPSSISFPIGRPTIKKKSGKQLIYKFSLDIDLVYWNHVDFFSSSSSYNAVVYIADRAMKEPRSINLGILNIRGDSRNGREVRPPSLYASPLLYQSDVALQPLPEIMYQRKPAAERPVKWKHDLFTALIVMAFGSTASVMWYYSSFFSCIRLPPLEILVFLITAACVLIVNFLYWMGDLNFALPHMMRYMMICFIPLLLSGYRVASSSGGLLAAEEALRNTSFAKGEKEQ